MFKIDFRKFISDRQWFGWYHVGWKVEPVGLTILGLRNSVWYRSEVHGHWRILKAGTDPCILVKKTDGSELMRIGVDGLKMGMEVEWHD